MGGLVKFPKLLFALLACTLSASAQINSSPGQWVGDSFLVFDTRGGAAYMLDGNNTIKERIPYVTETTDSPILSALRSRRPIGWHNDGLYGVAGADEKAVDGSLFRRFTFEKWQNKGPGEGWEWDVVGSYKSTDGNLFKFIPCDNDLFIAVSAMTDINGNTGQDITPFARMSLNPANKEIRVISSIGHGQDELREHMSNPEYFRLAYFAWTIITDSHAILLNYSNGLYWVFSLENASLVKTGNIFKIMTPELMVKGGGYGGIAVLSAHPEKDGTVLISAREEAALSAEIDSQKEMLEFEKLHKWGQPDQTITNSEFRDFQDRLKNKVVGQNRWIEWYRLYPESGKAEKIMNPEGAAIDREGGKNDPWRPMPDGSVKMGTLTPEEPKKAAPETKQEDKAPEKLDVAASK
jgi:hypothetical protein